MEKFFAAISILVKVLVFDVVGTVHIGSGWTNTKMSSSVHSTDPVAVYEVDKVLLPEAIFGTDIPPTLAPVPAPNISPAADAPTASDEVGSPRASSTPSSSYRLSAKVVSHDGNFPDSLTGYKSIKLLIIRHELYKLRFK
ncbi:Fasciclin-like arabinogalactan protein 7 [Vitis vinifera]|uniref:Fasciclin-like arabinogalactan protein 7 n=1 Tax=Vitis vinifera TaxID=29760 RepID=A0A438GAB0_VITVI|nr:Fasciclin-like arabinogalactan protein 7 [Vitis vinifera]